MPSGTGGVGRRLHWRQDPGEEYDYVAGGHQVAALHHLSGHTGFGGGGGGSGVPSSPKVLEVPGASSQVS
jgi:hypothetical protein